MRTLNLVVIIATTVLAVSSCAKQTSPTGGPRDTIPPQMQISNPKKGAIQTNPGTITLTFDEAVILNNPKEQILITPDFEKKYDIEAKNKTVTIKLQKELLPNTTYLINFRDAVQDITEKNPVRDLKLAFSTGQYIDSLKISGTVNDLHKNQPVKDATVALYTSDTFNIFKHRPTYITKTNDKGLFQFEYLKNQTYYIYAFDDKNKNLITDSKAENFGFKRDSIPLNTNKKGVSLNTIRLDSRPQKLTSTRPYNTYTTINFVKGLKEYQLRTEKADTIFSTFGESRSTIQIYNSFPKLDSLPIIVNALDSINQKIDTTIYVKFSTREIKPEKFSLGITDVTLIASKGRLTAKGTFSKPLAQMNTDSVYLKLDSVNLIQIPKEAFRINNTTRELTISTTIPKNTLPKPETADNQQRSQKPQYELRFGKGAFISIEADSSTGITSKINPLQDEDLGIIHVEIQSKKSRYILELLTKDYKQVRISRNQPKTTFSDLAPGEYVLRVTNDLDGDGQWTPGNFLARKEPEEFHYYLNEKKQTSISLKANWELGPLLITF